VDNKIRTANKFFENSGTLGAWERPDHIETIFMVKLTADEICVMHAS
jgi:hypothetical protein